MTNKPRIRFCWECGRKLWGNHFVEIGVDGFLRIMHKSCGRKYGQKTSLLEKDRMKDILIASHKRTNKAIEELRLVLMGVGDAALGLMKAAENVAKAGKEFQKQLEKLNDIQAMEKYEGE